MTQAKPKPLHPLLMTDERRLPDPVAVLRRLPRGAGVVLRHYDDPGRGELARILAQECRRRHLSLLVAADWRLAARVGAAGVHLPEGLAARGVLAPLLLWWRRRNGVLSVACHSVRALARARGLGADMALLSPVFATASHAGAKGMGALRFNLWSRRAKLPVLALGGVDRTSVRRLKHAAGFAAISGLK